MGAGEGDVRHVPHDEIGAGAGFQMPDLVLPAQARGTADRGGIERVARRHGCRPVPVAAEKQRRAGLQPHRRMIGRSRSVAAKPDMHSAPPQPHQVGRAASDQHVRAGTLRHADARMREPVDLLVAGIDEMGHPRAPCRPAHALEILDGRAAVDLLAIDVFLGILGKMGMQPEIMGLGQRRRFLHDALRHREQGAGGQRQPAHRAGFGVVVGLDQPDAVREDIVLRLDDRCRRQAALFHRTGHRASRGVEPVSDILRGAELRVDQKRLRMHIHVVHRCRAAAHQELGHRDICRQIDRLLVEPGPKRVEPGQPFKQCAVGDGRVGAGQVLVHVMVGVDQAGVSSRPPAGIVRLASGSSPALPTE